MKKIYVAKISLRIKRPLYRERAAVPTLDQQGFSLPGFEAEPKVRLPTRTRLLD